MAEYKICTKTIMDNVSDPDIIFDENGVSNYVRIYDERIKRRVPPKSEAPAKLEAILNEIKAAGKGKQYDCLLGVSGGVDSSYTAYLTKKFGLRPLAVHLDNGWDSELAVSNIHKLLKLLDIDLFTEVLDWEEFKKLQISFLKASTPDAEIPTDHAIWGCLYRVASKYNIKYIISGTNIRTEGIQPKYWSQGHLDWLYLKDVNNRFEKSDLSKFPGLTYAKLFYYIVLRKIKKVNILDYVDYNKSEAMKILQDELGWKYYGGKHYESIYTRVFQGYILPKKFNIDKRRAHLSTLICSGEITRDEALEEIKKDPYPDQELKKNDYEYTIKKFGLTEKEFENIMNLPLKTINDYNNGNKYMDFLYKIYRKNFYK